MFSTILSSTFETPAANPQLSLIRSLKQAHPGSQSVSLCECSSTSFPLDEYLNSVGIPVDTDESETHETINGSINSITVAGIFRFKFESVEYIVYTATWKIDYPKYYFYHLVFDSPDNTPGKELARAVYRWASIPKEEVWVYEDESWSKSKDLYRAIRSSDWDSIVLKDEFREGLKRDVGTFFGSRDTYASLNITWKRGILLLGPPGNGKTESIKALLNEFKHVEALYVKSFTTRYGPELGVRQIFSHARKHVPCILVIEDLDSLVTRKVRSFFLNELDGLAQNSGILTIATTNHPERIDDAILNRPSRFDVKYNFTLPEYDLRKSFSLKWLKKIQDLGENIGVVFDNLERTATLVADKTETWSFAFLKELFVSFMLRIAHDITQKSKIEGGNAVGLTSEAVLLDQIEKLASQIIRTDEILKKEKKKGKASDESEGEEEEEEEEEEA